MNINPAHYNKTLVFKDDNREKDLFIGRLRAAFALIVVMALILLGRYYYLQIINYEHYTTRSDANRIHTMAIAPARGLIEDLNGEVLAESRPSFTLAVIRERVEDMDATLNQLAQLVAISDTEMTRFKDRLKRRNRPYEGLPLKTNLNEEEIAKISLNRYRLPGIEINAEMVRHYPHGELFAHTIGYVGRINQKELEQIEQDGKLEAYHGVFSMGKVGIEKSYEAELLGVPGAQNVETNVRGRILRTLDRTDPQRGKTLTLYLNVEMQKAAVAAMNGRRGAVVAIDVKTGGIVTAVSTPSYDPNLFVTGISSKDYGALRDSLDLPLLNRITAGEYPPGSTIKPHLFLAGLEHGAVTPATTFWDPGYFQLPNQTRKFRDWKRGGHGTVDWLIGIAQSCDIYFYQLANRLGIDKMHSFMSQFDLGARTGVDLPGERRGVLPSREWKRERFKQAWYPGDTINAGIGQGYHLTTPLQLAQATATLARKGVRIRPHVVKAIDGIDIQPTYDDPIILKEPKWWDLAIKGMHEVAQGSIGTAKKSFMTAEYTVAGKTGTAQVVGIAQNAKYDSKKLAERQRDHGLFIAFAPVEDPQVAIAVVVENGDGGSSSAAPVGRQVLDAWLLHKMPENIDQITIAGEEPAAASDVPAGD